MLNNILQIIGLNIFSKKDLQLLFRTLRAGKNCCVFILPQVASETPVLAQGIHTEIPPELIKCFPRSQVASGQKNEVKSQYEKKHFGRGERTEAVEIGMLI